MIRGYFELFNYFNEEKVGLLLNIFCDLGFDDLEGYFVDVR